MKSFRKLFCTGILVSLSSLLWHGQLVAETSANCATSAIKIVLKGAAARQPLTGRLLIFAKMGHGATTIDANEFEQGDVWVAAEELYGVSSGELICVNTDENAYPRGFSMMAAGDWQFQAILDTQHDYVYSGRTPEDWTGLVVSVPSDKKAGEIELTLQDHPTPDPHQQARNDKSKAAIRAGEIEQFEISSAILTSFWGRPKQVSAWIVLPPSYAIEPETKYPTAYWIGGFGGGPLNSLFMGNLVRQEMLKRNMPPMIWVMIDESTPEGTHEFVDSVNDGPWSTAFVREFMPAVAAKYRMQADAAGRLLTGHSSGGWASLHLQLANPDLFGGTWSTSPDPTDFHDFLGVDLYAPGANMYRLADGTSRPFAREGGKIMLTVEQAAKIEAVFGEYGGQLASFEWVFSPKSDAGKPQELFDRRTGNVDPRVARYWAQNYDLANLAERAWNEAGTRLAGKIHVTVGTMDTYYLDGPARKFDSRLQRLGAQPHFTYVFGRSHYDLYTVGSNPVGLLDQIGKEMYATARASTH